MLSVRAERRTTRGRWLRSCAVGVLVAVGAAACGEEADQAPDLPLAGEIERFDVGSDPAVVFKPEGDVEGMLIYHHGAGETIDELVELQSRSTSLVGHLLEEGWAVAATAAGGDHWGSQAGIDANTALWEALDDDLRADSVVLLGHSMGGVSSLSCIVQECVPGIDGWIGIYPLVDQRSLVGSSIAAEALPAIEQTFGGAPPPALIPLEQADALAEVPMVVWASPDDEVVPMETNAAELARRVEAAGGQVTLHTASGPHGDPSHYDAEAILDFLHSLEP